MSGGLHVDPGWPRAAAWLAGHHSPGASRQLAVLGAPSCLGSITKGRCDRAPAAIRRALKRYSTYNVVNGADVRQVQMHDRGDLPVAGQVPGESFAAIRDAPGENVVQIGIQSFANSGAYAAVARDARRRAASRFGNCARRCAKPVPARR
jgi:arginase family enzyme